jgi:putative ABC transport system permease protein
LLSLALGIGANTAIFQLVDAVGLRTLPVRDPEELVSIDLGKDATRDGWSTGRSARLSYAIFDELRKRQQAFSTVLAWSATRFNLNQGGERRYAEGLFVSADFFRALDVMPPLCRTFGEADDQPACASAGAVIGYAFWQREYGGNAAILGGALTIEGHSFPIIGVTPRAVLRTGSGPPL